MTASEHKNKASIPAQDDFFLPDLCEVRAVFFLVLVAELLALMLEVNDEGLRAFDWYSFGLDSLFMQWTVLSSAACLCALRPLLTRLPIEWAASCSYLLIVSLTLLLGALGQWMLAGAFSGSGNWQLDGWGLASTGLIAAVLAGIALRYFYLTKELQLRQQAELQAKIEALQSRIRPHFLFNSMNIIASLIAVDQQAAETAVEDLSALFRASLNEVDTEVSLATELEFCRSYARIEQLRLDSRLQLDWQIDQLPALDHDAVKIPSLSLQPLLENAIYHGIQLLPEGGRVTVEAELRGEGSEIQLWLTVSNPLPETNAAINGGGNHIAQGNIHHRLQALYGPSAGLHTEQRGGCYRASIHYPFDAQEAR